jgi:hypothetical protein
MTETNIPTVAPNADPPKLTPEEVIAQLRTVRSQIDDVAPLSQDQRRLVRQRLHKQSKPVVDASINVIGVLDNVSQAIGHPLEGVRRLQDEVVRWDAAIDEARAFLKGLEGGSLIRRERLTLLATQAYAIGAQLAKDPGEGRAPAPCRGSQTAERRLAPQEGGAGTSAPDGPDTGTGARNLHTGKTVDERRV